MRKCTKHRIDEAHDGYLVIIIYCGAQRTPMCNRKRQRTLFSLHLTSVRHKVQFMRQCMERDAADDKPGTKPTKNEEKIQTEAAIVIVRFSPHRIVCLTFLFEMKRRKPLPH